jgi:hypothetical protein
MTHAEILARQEEMRRAGTLPGAKGTGTVAAPKPARVPLALCVYLGDRVSAACGELARRCNLYGCTTAAVARCPKADRFCPECPDLVPAGGSGAG